MSVFFVSQLEDIENTKGVLFFPKDDEKKFETVESIHWIFVADCSTSMDSPLNNPEMKDCTRWKIAKVLMEEAVKEILSQKRHNDIITLLAFNQEVKSVWTGLSMKDWQDTNFDLLKTIRPSGSTNIELANAMVHLTMMNDPLVCTGQRKVAQLFFTDGEATEGLRMSDQLKQQKLDLYDLFMAKNKKSPQDIQEPFIWCAAIGHGDRNVVKDLSLTSKHSLWVTIGDKEIMNFAREMGTAIAAALFSRKVQFRTEFLQKSPNFYREHVYWLLQDTCGMIYVETRPLIQDLRRVVDADMVKLYEIQHHICLLEEKEWWHIDESKALLTTYLQQLRDLPKLTTDVDENSEDFQMMKAGCHVTTTEMRDILHHYEKTYATLETTLQDLLKQCEAGEMPVLQQQCSMFRASSGGSNTVKTISSALHHVFRSKTCNEKKDPPITNDPLLAPPVLRRSDGWDSLNSLRSSVLTSFPDVNELD